MKIFCCYTPAHAVLFERYFRPSLPDELEVQAYQIELGGRGDFLSAEYLACLQRKIELVAESVRACRGEIILWSDVDIIFQRPVAAELAAQLASTGCDILFQREGPRTTAINGGFYVLRASEPLERFFHSVRDELAAHPGMDDQWAMNRLLPSASGFQWGYLPSAFYARTHGWPPPADLAIYHANETPGADGIGQKMRQFEELARVQRYGWPVLLWSCALKIPKRLRRWSREVKAR